MSLSKSMFKIRLLQRREEVALLAVLVGMLLLAIVNIALMVPSLAAAFLPEQQQTQDTEIDTDTIEQAISVIRGE